MGSTRRRFTDEYKGHAVRLVLDSSDSIAEIARSIGVHEMTLGKWVKKARDDGEESQRPLDEDERATLDRLMHTLAETARGEDAHAIDAATKALGDGTETFAAVRMNRGIQQALTGRRLDDV